MFGYGSLLWRPGFDPAETRAATVSGWARRFWQASHDHRGTPELPGRVVTLVEMPGAHCEGLVHRLPDRERKGILDRLDHRERDGYRRLTVRVRLADASTVPAITWVADPLHPSWVGEAGEATLMATLRSATGQSGHNRDYLLDLAATLARLGIDDPYIAALAQAL